jgi:hypothetical protein
MRELPCCGFFIITQRPAMRREHSVLRLEDADLQTEDEKPVIFGDPTLQNISFT